MATMCKNYWLRWHRCVKNIGLENGFEMIGSINRPVQLEHKLKFERGKIGFFFN